jgi:sentrin-specific protease 8
MSFMLMATADPMTLKDALPSFEDTTHIFLPINDNRNVEQAEGGSHWSLLLVSTRDAVAFHYDSLGNANEAEARLVNHKLAILLGVSLRFTNMDDTPLQENGSDCGVFVCLIMRYLLQRRLLRATADEKVGMSMHGRELNASMLRKEMLKIIDDFRKEGQKRSSS